MMYGNAGTRPERAWSDGFVSTDKGKVSSQQPVTLIWTGNQPRTTKATIAIHGGASNLMDAAFARYSRNFR